MSLQEKLAHFGFIPSLVCVPNKNLPTQPCSIPTILGNSKQLGFFVEQQRIIFVLRKRVTVLSLSNSLPSAKAYLSTAESINF